MLNLKEFKRNVLSTSVYSFEMNDKNCKCSFIVQERDRARYIFYDTWYDEDALDQEYKLLAIVFEGKIYVIDRYHLDAYQGFNDPDFVPFSDFVTEFVEYAVKEIVPEYYNEIEIVPDKKTLEAYTSNARNILLGDDLIKDFELNIEGEPINRVLRGIVTREQMARTIIEKQLNRLKNYKERVVCIEKLLETNSCAEEWEIAMAKALRDSNAQNVSIEFSMNERNSTVKLPVVRIRSALIEKDWFGTYNFLTSKEGERVYEELGLKAWGEHPYSVNISEISFRGKTIYRREDYK